MKNGLSKLLALLVLTAFILSACGPSASKNKVDATAVSKTVPAAASKPGAPAATVPPAADSNNSQAATRAAPPAAQSAGAAFHFAGKGAKSLDIVKPAGAFVLHITHDGKNEFSVHNFDAQATDLGELVNASGAYDGVLAADLEKTQTTRLEIKADGNWVVDIFPLDKQFLHQVAVPGHYAASGDDVVFLTGAVPDVGTFKTEANDASFIVHTFNGSDLYGIVHENNPYSGTAIVPSGTLIMIVQTRGKWSVDISAN